jgi:predicted RNase H-like HicB family nuclease/DNA-binding XRE family transcriptional regulator
MEYYCKLTEQDGMYIVEFPDLPEVLTYGDTQEEALRNAQDALNGAVASDVARGLNIPQPVFYADLFPIELDPVTSIALQLRFIRGSESQTDIASKLGLTYQAYQRLENPSKGNPTIKTLERVAAALGKKLEIRLA